MLTNIGRLKIHASLSVKEAFCVGYIVEVCIQNPRVTCQ
jgi:hypothetical protein